MSEKQTVKIKTDEPILLNDPLPNKLHELITLALQDLTACKANGYEINMNTWFAYYHDSDFDDDGKPFPRCQVCLAGAVIAKSLKFENITPEPTEWSTEISPGRFSEATLRNKLYALNQARQGSLFEAIESFYCFDCFDNTKFLTEYEKLHSKAWEVFGGELNVHGSLKSFTDYEEDEELWFSKMRDIADKLRKADL